MNVLSSILNFIGNTIGSETMGTTATTLTGAIAEHESDIAELQTDRANYFVFTSLSDMVTQLADYSSTVAMFKGTTGFCGDFGGDLADHTCGGYVYKLSSVTYDMCVISSLTIFKCRYRSDTDYKSVTQIG